MRLIRLHNSVEPRRNCSLPRKSWITSQCDSYPTPLTIEPCRCVLSLLGAKYLVTGVTKAWDNIALLI